jgi:hypothetical protein
MRCNSSMFSPEHSSTLMPLKRLLLLMKRQNCSPFTLGMRTSSRTRSGRVCFFRMIFVALSAESAMWTSKPLATRSASMMRAVISLSSTMRMRGFLPPAASFDAEGKPVTAGGVGAAAGAGAGVAT